jgi:hypothetical protein
MANGVQVLYSVEDSCNLNDRHELLLLSFPEGLVHDVIYNESVISLNGNKICRFGYLRSSFL